MRKSIDIDAGKVFYTISVLSTSDVIIFGKPFLFLRICFTVGFLEFFCAESGKKEEENKVKITWIIDAITALSLSLSPSLKSLVSNLKKENFLYIQTAQSIIECATQVEYDMEICIVVSHQINDRALNGFSVKNVIFSCLNRIALILPHDSALPFVHMFV